jgi:hypothetical protein
MAKKLLAGELEEGTHILVGLKKDDLTFKAKVKAAVTS